MDKNNIQQQIVSHFWSETLKKYIAETGHTFTDEELLGLIWWFVPEYQERLRLLGLIVEHIPTVAEYAKLSISHMETALDYVQQCGKGEVYELRIVDLDEPEERYLCDSYHTALKMIDAFWEEYDSCHEKPTTKYIIVKRSIRHATDDFREDELGRCELGPGKVLLAAETQDFYNWEPMPESSDILFPDFLPNLITVKYRWCGKTAMGLVFEPKRGGPCDSVYIMPLGGKTDPDWWDHNHVPHPDVDIASEGDLSDEQKEAVGTLRTFLANWMKEHIE